jgi:prolyl-tRNA synthetase
LRGDHDLNEIKAQKVVGEFRFARDEEIVEALGCKAGYIGAGRFLRARWWRTAASP